MISVEYHDDLKEVQGDAALAALFGAPAARAPFDRIEWWRGLAECCEIIPLIAVARQGDALAALALTRVKRRIEALANWYSFRVSPLVSPDADRSALLAALARDLIGEAPRITLDRIPDDNGEATALATAFKDAGWLVLREVCDSNHVLEVQGRSFADYLAGRPGQLRTTLKRKGSRVEIQLFDRFDENAWSAFEAIYAASWKPEEGNPRFLERFAREEGTAGRLRMGMALAEGQPVAAQFWTVEAGTAFIHKLAHREDAKTLSPGTTLSAALFERVIDTDKVDLVDFGTGDDGYKRDWMELVRLRYRLDMLRPAWPENWPVLLRHGLRRLAGKLQRG